MIRAGTAAALLAVSCAEPRSVNDLLDVIAVRTGDAPLLESARSGVHRLCKEGLLRVARPGRCGRVFQPTLYTLTPAGEAELDRLFAEASA